MASPSFYLSPVFCRVSNLFDYTRLFFIFSHLFDFLPFLPFFSFIFSFLMSCVASDNDPHSVPHGNGARAHSLWWTGTLLYFDLSLLLLHMCVYVLNMCWHVCVSVRGGPHSVHLYTMWLGCWWLSFWGCHETHYWRAATENEQRYAALCCNVILCYVMLWDERLCFLIDTNCNIISYDFNHPHYTLSTHTSNATHTLTDTHAYTL